MNDIISYSKQVKEELSKYKEDEIEQAEIETKYFEYIEKEEVMANKLTTLEDYKLVDSLDYDALIALSTEGREKLKKQKPFTLGQASRISGVSAADISVLMVYIGR
jgi:tRNA uridine 5-carboxymethylaminomethyl modification enzyme